MNELETDWSSKAQELRRSFDRSFATPRCALKKPSSHLLLILVSGRRYALRVVDLLGLYLGRKITPLPATDPALLGIVGIRGQLIPTYSLAALLNCAAGSGEHRSMVLCGESKLTVGLAFDQFIGSTKVSESDLCAASAAERLPVHISQVARTVPEMCYVISTASILKDIGCRADQSGARGASDAGKGMESYATRR